MGIWRGLPTKCRHPLQLSTSLDNIPATKGFAADNVHSYKQLPTVQLLWNPTLGSIGDLL